jgi:hypothetical protein
LPKSKAAAKPALKRTRQRGAASPASARRAGAASAKTKTKTKAKTKTGSLTRADPHELAALPDDALLEHVQRQTFGYFWQGAHPDSGLPFDRRTAGKPVDPTAPNPITISGTGFGVMALIVAVERGWITRDAALERLSRMLDVLLGARIYHGAYPHFMNGRTGETITFWRKDDAGDLVETSFLAMGMLCARQYFDRDTPLEGSIRWRAAAIWDEVEWSWFTQGRDVLYWHWSPYNGWAMNHEIRGWNECLVTYVLAASSQRYPIEPQVYHRGFASGNGFRNDHSWHGTKLPLGMPYGGPLFFTHYSFLGLDPRGLTDAYADYWEQNVRHVRINRAHCLANPGGFAGYGESCWGLTASDDPGGYSAHAPDNDNGTISPTAALASLPYAPTEVMPVIRHLLERHGTRVWREFGFVDAFCESRSWFADTFLAVDQGPIVVMIENHRTGLLWNLFMAVPEVQNGLRRLGFSSPHLDPARQ